MEFQSILFLCVANSARSQMAEGLARAMFGDAVRVHSAGSAPTQVNPLAGAAMEEIGISLATHHAKSVQDLNPDEVDLVVTLCAEEVCPVFLGQAKRLHWPLPDPDRSGDDLSAEERLQAFRDARDSLQKRLNILQAMHQAPCSGVEPREFHLSLRTPDLAATTRFYSWLFALEPSYWTDRFAVFDDPRLKQRVVFLVADGKELHHDTLYHLGIGVANKAEVLACQTSAAQAGLPIVKPARTTWRNMPLHELWLEDPGGNLVEVYAMLTPTELAAMPEDQEPVLL